MAAWYQVSRTPMRDALYRLQREGYLDIRGLDFTQPTRVEATYQEHGKLLNLVLRRKCTEALLLLRSHIQESKLEARKITLHKLHEAQLAGK